MFFELKSSYEICIIGFYFLGLGWIILNWNVYWWVGEFDKSYNFDSYKNIFIC